MFTMHKGSATKTFRSNIQQYSCDDDCALELLLDDPYLDQSLEQLRPNRPRRSASLGMDIRLATRPQDEQYRIPRIRRRRRTLSRELLQPQVNPSLLRKRLGESETDELISAHRVEEWSRRTRDSSFPSHAVWSSGMASASTSSPKCRKRGDEPLYTPELECRCIGGIIAAHVLHNSRTNRCDDSQAPSRRQELSRVFDPTTSTQTVVNVLGFGESEIRNIAHRPECPPPPTVQEVFLFVHQLFVDSRMEEECLLIALIYIDRLLYVGGSTAFQSFDAQDPTSDHLPCYDEDRGGGLLLTSRNWKAVALTALMLASKVWDDFSMINADFVLIMNQRGSTITLDRLAELESAMLDLLRYHMMVTGPEYAQAHFRLQEMVSRLLARKSQGVAAAVKAAKTAEGDPVSGDRGGTLRRLWPKHTLRQTTTADSSSSLCDTDDLEPSTKRSRDHIISGNGVEVEVGRALTAATPLMFAMSMTDQHARCTNEGVDTATISGLMECDLPIDQIYSGEPGSIHTPRNVESSINMGSVPVGVEAAPPSVDAVSGEHQLTVSLRRGLVGKCWDVVAGWLD